MDEGANTFIDWLALLRAPGLGPTGRRALLTRFGTPAAVRRAVAQGRAGTLPAATVRFLRGSPGADADVAWLRGPDHHLITWHDPRYPVLLRELADAPLALFVDGAPERLASLQVAVVGSRNPTPAGAETAFRLARALAAAGLTVTSGLAAGIDAAAHQGALAAGGSTVAVAGTGLDRVYPARHRDLGRRIAAQGALVSEFPTGTPPRRHHFPLRNRLISGLSMGVVVAEAARGSGSLITARHAAQQGREVFAIPGSIHNPLTRGCHALIRDGAKLVENVQDVLEELPALARAAVGPMDTSGGAPAAAPETLEPRERMVLEALGCDPASADVLVARTGLTAGTVSAILLQLELRALVKAAPGGRYVRAVAQGY